MLQLIGTAELSATSLFTISSANPNAAGREADEHQASALFAPDRNGLPQIVSREDALCMFEAAEYAKKRVVPRKLRFTARSASVFGLNGANLDFGAITSKWSAPTYAQRPAYSTILTAALGAVSPDEELSASLGIGEALQTALVSNGLYMTLRSAGAMYPSGTSQGTASVRLMPVTLETDVYEIQPEAQNVWPNAGYVQPGAEIVVTWTFFAENGARETPKQAAYELEYRVLRSDGTQSGPFTIMGANAKHASIPAEAAEGAEAIWYRLRLWSDDGVWGGWTEEIRLSTIPLSRRCAGVSPSGRYLSEGEDVLFVWRHASEEGLPQARTRIFASSGAAGAYFLLADLEQRAQSAVLRIPGGLESGELRWYAITTDEHGADSLPSEPIANILLAAPAAPVIERVSDEARPRVLWRSGEQEAYRMRVFDEAGALRFDTGMLSGMAYEARCGEYLAPGQYTFEITVWNEYGLPSASRMNAGVTVPCLTPAAITLSLVEGGVRIGAEPPGGQYSYEYEAIELFRGGVRIARILREDPPCFEDYRAHGPCVYYVRLLIKRTDTILPEQYGDSETGIITPYIVYPMLAPAQKPDAFLRLDMRRGGAPIRKCGYEPEGAPRLLMGRSAAEYNAGAKGRSALRKREMSFSLCSAAEFAALKAMAESGEALLYRDEDEKFYGACTRFEYERTPDGWDFTLELAEVEFEEELRG